MPADASGGTLTIGGRQATITTTVTQYPPYTAEPFPSTYLNFTIPAGTPGYADLQITTPDGSGALPKAIFYARSVTDFASTDTFTDVLYDEARKQVYLSAGDHKRGADCRGSWDCLFRSGILRERRRRHTDPGSWERVCRRFHSSRRWPIHNDLGRRCEYVELDHPLRGIRSSGPYDHEPRRQHLYPQERYLYTVAAARRIRTDKRTALPIAPPMNRLELKPAIG